MRRCRVPTGRRDHNPDKYISASVAAARKQDCEGRRNLSTWVKCFQAGKDRAGKCILELHSMDSETYGCNEAFIGFCDARRTARTRTVSRHCRYKKNGRGHNRPGSSSIRA